MEFQRFGTKVVLRLDKGEEVLAGLRRLCDDQDIRLGMVTGIGAVNLANVGIFVQDTKEYHTRQYKGSMEIVSLLGNISRMQGETYIHLHVTLTGENYEAFGGHLNEAWVGATCELIIDVIDGRVERELSPEIGLNLIKY